MKKKIAVILCGSGFKDGSEIREAVAVLWALSQEPVEVQCFAPDAPQHDVVNCFTGQSVAGETRNMLVEAARIARGNILPLSKLDANDYAAVVMPGGFGAAKNLSTFAFKGSGGTVRPDVEAVLRAFHAANNPIGAVCIAPAVVALAFKGKGLELTVGAGGEAAQEIEKLGHRHHECAANEILVDAKNRVVTTPAYMFDDAPLHEVFTGIQKLVRGVVKLA
jgi:enhancing lycopene biosynthesis protein 2